MALREQEEHDFCGAAQNEEWDSVFSRLSSDPTLVNAHPSQRWSALHQAVACCNSAAVQRLLGYRADINYQAGDGSSPLTLAQTFGFDLQAMQPSAVAPPQLVAQAAPVAQASTAAPSPPVAQTAPVAASSQPELQRQSSHRGNRRFVWHDPCIFEHENSVYMEMFSANDWQVQPFAAWADAVRFLLDRADASETWLVVTSGRDGQMFVEAIHDMSSVASIAIFCNSVEFHREWSQRFAKVGRVMGSLEIFEDGVQTLERLLAGAAVINFVDQQVGPWLVQDPHVSIARSAVSANYYVESADVAMGFMLVMQRMHTQITEEMVVSCVRELVAPTQVESFELSWAGPWVRASEIVPRNVVPRSLLQKMTLGWTSEFFYRSLNEKLANPSALESVLNFVGRFTNDAMQPDVQSEIGYACDEPLYRVVPTDRVRDSDYAVGSSFYWPNLAATSKQPQYGFAPQGGYVFKILSPLRSDGRHPTIDLERCDDWGHFAAGEREVLFLPFGRFQVVRWLGPEQPYGPDGPTYWTCEVRELPSVYQLYNSPQAMREWVDTYAEHLHRQIHEKLHHIFEYYINEDDNFHRYFEVGFEEDLAEVVREYWERFAQSDEWEDRKTFSSLLEYIFSDPGVPSKLEQRFKRGLQRGLNDGEPSFRYVMEMVIHQMEPVTVAVKYIPGEKFERAIPEMHRMYGQHLRLGSSTLPGPAETTAWLLARFHGDGPIAVLRDASRGKASYVIIHALGEVADCWARDLKEVLHAKFL